MAKTHDANGDRLRPIIDFIEKELAFLDDYRESVTWKIYENKREKRLEVERWAESVINATLDVLLLTLI